MDKKKVKEISFKLLIESFLFVVAIFIFALIAHEVVGENEDQFDTKVFHFLKTYSSPRLTHLMKMLTYFGTPYFIIPAYLFTIAFLFIKKQKQEAIDVIIIAISSSFLLFILKGIFQRHRPDLPLLRELHGYSFPSGHALITFIFSSVLIHLAWQSDMQKKWKYILACFLILVSLAIGASRIVLRYHYASDVLAGFALGFAWVILSFWVQKRLLKRKKLMQ